MAPTALFVVDIQVELARSPSEIPHAKRIRDAGEAILAKARARIDESHSTGNPPPLEVLVVQHEESPKDGTLVRGSEAWEVVFPPRNGERLVAKDVGDTFESNPQLATELKSEGVETVVVFGIQSEHCVISTCKGALAAGFKVILLGGAHSTYDDEGKKAEDIEKDVEGELQSKGVLVIPWDEWQP